MKSTAELDTTENSSANLPNWDLSDLYTDIDAPEIKEDLRKATDHVHEFNVLYAGKTTSIKGKELVDAISFYDKIQDIIGKISSYAQLIYASDMSDEKNSAFYQNISEQLNEISSDLLFFELKINKKSEEELQYEIEMSPELKHYAPWIRDVSAFRKHQLDDDVEKALHQKSVTGRQAWVRLFDETIASLQFPFQGEQVTCAEILDKLSSDDAKERKEAAKSIGSVFGDNIKTFSFITNTLAKDKGIDDSLRHFSKPISSRNLDNLIEDEVVDALLGAVKSNYSSLSHRYYKLKAKWLDKEKLDYWDRNAPFPNQDNSFIEWNDAQTIVLDAYHDFSPELAKIGKQFFDNNWIDVPPKKGKDSGAFAHPTVPSVHPYLLLNYQGKIRDVMTLAHELGHGVHQCLSAKQGALMSYTPLTLAETASVFGEQLTFRALLETTKDPEQRKLMIANKVEDMLNTVVRQVAFCEFERLVHDERKKGELSVDQIGQFWMRVQKESLGEGIQFDEEYQYYWAYIPHFIHSPFYVYSYAFGDCLVNALYATYQEQPEGFEA
ncbi:MAG: M3 family oligoendopeptidase, partial [Rickettsiales bacterium]|nr:M3 family oligoendopeptidase [Rickettsiales bacterium]